MARTPSDLQDQLIAALEIQQEETSDFFVVARLAAVERIIKRHHLTKDGLCGGDHKLRVLWEKCPEISDAASVLGVSMSEAMLDAV